MRFAVTLPHFGPYADARLLSEMALEAEQAGWDGFFIWDHISWGMSGTPMVDPWVALTAVAMTTSRVRFGPMVTPLPRRRPTKVARETVSLDRLSGGRLIQGVGIGEGEDEWQNLGDEGDPKVRGAMLDEALDLLVKLWSGQAVDHEGAFYTVRHSIYLPTPVQQPRIPIWVAGKWPNKRPFLRAARWDGVVPLKQGGTMGEVMTPGDLREVRDYVLEHRSVEAPFDVVVGGHTSGKDRADDAGIVAPYIEVGATWWVEDISPWTSAGWSWGAPWPLDAMRERIRSGPPV